MGRRIYLLNKTNMEMKLSFNQWLTLLNPNCKLRITTEQGYVYESKNRDNLNFEMTLIGFDFN